MQDFSFFHDSFNLRKLSSYLLNIQLTKYGLCYVMIDVLRDQHIAIQHKEFENPDEDIIVNFKNTLKDDIYLNKHYKAVNFYLVNDKYTLVPEVYFDRKHLKDYFKYNQYLAPEEEVHFTNIPEAKIYNVFAYPIELTSFLVSHFPEVRLFHATVPFIHYMLYLSQELNINSEILGINFYDSSFDVFVLKNQEPLLLNNFHFNTEEDAVYYIMNVISMLGLDKTKISMILQGNIRKQDKRFTYLKEMIINVRLSRKFKREFLFKDIPAHYFSNMLIDF